MLYFINVTAINFNDNFDTSEVTTIAGMFYNDISLTNVDLSSFDTSNVTDMRVMFSNTTNLESIYVSDGWDTSNADTTNMFST